MTLVLKELVNQYCSCPDMGAQLQPAISRENLRSGPLLLFACLEFARG
jgi:hypothetical protein